MTLATMRPAAHGSPPDKQNQIMPKSTHQPKKLHVYAMNCSWHGSIDKVKVLGGPGGIPCCPFCESMLMQADEEGWFLAARQHDKDGHENYYEFLKWTEQQPRCWKSLEAAIEAFFVATGKQVQF